jgi:hypothetical protein
MASDPTCQDSPLSITASVIGILTFIVAVIIGFYARLQGLNALRAVDDEIIQVLRTTIESFHDTRTLGEYIMRASNPGTGNHGKMIRSVIEEMFALSFQNSLALIKLLRNTRIWRISQ